ncbi:MAG: hypothetical protein H6Q90_158 [Deltaproteobacteria bacterium]|nr:hypothetical protein [Deltaproteobacteria bacterium]
MAVAAVLALAACKTTAPTKLTSPVPDPDNQVTALPAGPATAVVRLAPAVPTAVLAGPFEAFSINPGGNLALAIAPAAKCDDPDLRWFGYSGGGVAVGIGQFLCARSDASELRTHAFSGHDGRPAENGSAGPGHQE